MDSNFTSSDAKETTLIKVKMMAVTRIIQTITDCSSTAMT